jgi:GT2 family glycosyltransferase
MNRVAIVVLNWNGIADTIPCLESLLTQSYRNYTIVLVDNGSIDNSLDVLDKFIPPHTDKIHLIKNDTNKGFAGGVNTGIRWVIENDYDYVALFNNDAVADKEWLTSLIAAASTSDEVGIATGLLLHENGKTIDSTGDWYSVWGLAFPRNRGDKVSHAPKDGLVFGASGGATLYKTALLKDIGLFDEDFFAYYEDVDISFRAQLAGHKVIYTPDAIAYHKQGATSNKIPGFAIRQTFKNLPLLFWKNVPNRLLLPIGLRFYLALLLIYGNSFTHHNGWSATLGTFKGLLLLPKALKQRRLIQKKKRVSSDYINEMIWHDLPPDQTGLRKFRRFFIGK